MGRFSARYGQQRQICVRAAHDGVGRDLALHTGYIPRRTSAWNHLFHHDSVSYTIQCSHLYGKEVSISRESVISRMLSVVSFNF